MLVLQNETSEGLLFDVDPQGAQRQSLYSGRRPWHIAASFCSLLLSEDRGLLTAFLILDVSQKEIVTTLRERWTSVETEDLSFSNMMIASGHDVLLLPQDRDGIEEAAQFSWQRGSYWHRLVVDHDYTSRLAQASSMKSAAAELLRTCSQEYVSQFDAQYESFSVRPGPNFLRIQALIDSTVRAMNKLYQ